VLRVLVVQFVIVMGGAAAEAAEAMGDIGALGTTGEVAPAAKAADGKTEIDVMMV